MNKIIDTPSFIPCGLLRRFAAIFYDSLLLFAVLFASTTILLLFTSGEAINSENLVYFIYLSICSFLFFGWPWTHGGQTLGMRAWKIILKDANNESVTWDKAGKRFLLAMVSWGFFGLGYVWAIFDPDKLAFHDRYSGTRLYHLKATKSSEK